MEGGKDRDTQRESDREQEKEEREPERRKRWVGGAVWEGAQKRKESISGSQHRRGRGGCERKTKGSEGPGGEAGAGSAQERA